MHKLWLVALVAAVGVAQAQTTQEIQLQGLAVIRSDEYLGAGLGAGLRSRGRTRIGAAGSLGVARRAVAFRGDLLLSYHLLPFRLRGVTPYAGGGISVLVVRNQVYPYLMLVAGVESAPGGPRGWFVEGGIAGGVRLTLGWRFRRRGRRR